MIEKKKEKANGRSKAKGLPSREGTERSQLGTKGRMLSARYLAAFGEEKEGQAEKRGSERRLTESPGKHLLCGGGLVSKNVFTRRKGGGVIALSVRVVDGTNLLVPEKTFGP